MLPEILILFPAPATPLCNGMKGFVQTGVRVALNLYLETICHRY